MQKNKIVIIGCGGHGKKMAEISTQLNLNLIGFLSNINKKNDEIDGVKIIGYLDDFINDVNLNDCNYHIGIGDNFTRYEIDQKLKPYRKRKTLISRHSIISDNSIIGEGCSINHGVIIQINVNIGDSAIIDTGSIIEHDCKIGNYVNIHPGSTLCGNVEIMDNSIIGAGSIIREKIKIGKNSLIGAGSVVVKDIPDNVIAFGNPAKIIFKERKFSDKYLK